jgi:hypothetical protein
VNDSADNPFNKYSMGNEFSRRDTKPQMIATAEKVAEGDIEEIASHSR